MVPATLNHVMTERRVLSEKPANTSLLPASKQNTAPDNDLHLKLDRVELLSQHSPLKNSKLAPSPSVNGIRKRSFAQVDEEGAAIESVIEQLPGVSSLHFPSWNWRTVLCPICSAVHCLFTDARLCVDHPYCPSETRCSVRTGE